MSNKLYLAIVAIGLTSHRKTKQKRNEKNITKSQSTFLQ